MPRKTQEKAKKSPRKKEIDDIYGDNRNVTKNAVLIEEIAREIIIRARYNNNINFILNCLGKQMINEIRDFIIDLLKQEDVEFDSNRYILYKEAVIVLYEAPYNNMIIGLNDKISTFRKLDDLVELLEIFDKTGKEYIETYGVDEKYVNTLFKKLNKININTDLLYEDIKNRKEKSILENETTNN